MHTFSLIHDVDLNSVSLFPLGQDVMASMKSIQENINMVYVMKCEMMSQDSDFVSVPVSSGKMGE